MQIQAAINFLYIQFNRLFWSSLWDSEEEEERKESTNWRPKTYWISACALTWFADSICLSRFGFCHLKTFTFPDPSIDRSFISAALDERWRSLSTMTMITVELGFCSPSYRWGNSIIHRQWLRRGIERDNKIEKLLIRSSTDWHWREKVGPLTTHSGDLLMLLLLRVILNPQLEYRESCDVIHLETHTIPLQVLSDCHVSTHEISSQYNLYIHRNTTNESLLKLLSNWYAHIHTLLAGWLTDSGGCLKTKAEERRAVDVSRAAVSGELSVMNDTAAIKYQSRSSWRLYYWTSAQLDCACLNIYRVLVGSFSGQDTGSIICCWLLQVLPR